MQITKSQMLNGAAKYIRGEVLPHIPDKGVKVIVETLASMVEMSPKIVNKYLENPVVSVMLQEEDGHYDLDMIETALVKAIEANGGLEVTVPSVPLLSPTPKSMTFSASDVRTLKRYMEGNV